VRHAPLDESIDVENPCTFVGHVDHFKGHRLIGTGNGERCSGEIKQMVSGRLRSPQYDQQS
jgi:hypothetical protein